MAIIKKISELEQMQSLSDSSNVLVEENGVAKRFPANAFGGGGSVAETDEKYFYITDDGLISLKDEYRGVGRTDYAYSVSNNGANLAGSLLSELPEVLVIPELVNEIAVTELAPAMFYNNTSVKKLILPNFIKVIPERFCDGALNLREVIGTENVEVINKCAFQYTGLEKAYFPNLKAFGDTNAFSVCPLMTSADIGEVAEIPQKTFYLNEKLSAVRTSGNITTVGNLAFSYTRRLKNLPFLKNVTKIGDYAFCGSRVIFTWEDLEGKCQFGTNATPYQYNKTDYWSGITPTKCKTELRSIHNQNDPRWAGEYVGDTTLTWGTNGCVAVSGAAIYSVFEEKDLASPEEFVEAVREAAVKKGKPELMSLDFRIHTNIKSWFDVLGYTADNYSIGSAETVQAMYDALARGDLIIASSVIPNAVQGHAVVLNGVTETGELIACDISAGASNIGVYSSIPFTSLYQNFIVTGSLTIIRKPNS